MKSRWKMQQGIYNAIENKIKILYYQDNIPNTKLKEF